MMPGPTQRLSFRRMTDDDLDDMCSLLGDPEAMRYYPHPKSRTEVQAWIDWTKRNYADHGFGLWVIEDLLTGEFVGDCGLTWQRIDDERILELGYHVLPAHQGEGLATEAARACLAYGLDVVGEPTITAIINPDNTASRRVAEHLGLSVMKSTNDAAGRPVVVYATTR